MPESSCSSPTITKIEDDDEHEDEEDDHPG
jgi:hypothetical protein